MHAHSIIDVGQEIGSGSLFSHQKVCAQSIYRVLLHRQKTTIRPELIEKGRKDKSHPKQVFSEVIKIEHSGKTEIGRIR